MEGCVAEKRFNFNDATASTPLSAIAEAFEEVEKLINLQKINGAQQFQLRLDTLCEACSPISILFRCLGLAFKFAELEYVSKIKESVNGGKEIDAHDEEYDTYKMSSVW
ncbi:hypothetical protein L484_012001 [Morus notabilis]|uniref:Uncharacterized protein n=1 Tax=Morus notabilis TaxID=981085 RepID=W9RQ02_9ROSA|nr:hypothetical protein L484_012001 [Morus notabilis]